VTTRAEQPVEVAVPEMHELRVQVANLQHAPREVVRHPKTTHVVVKEEVVPVELQRQKAQYVPQVQTIELIKEEPQQVIKRVQKSIPKYEMKYINNVITVGPKYMEHVQDVEEEFVETYETSGGATSLFNQLDSNHDGVITRQEFAAMGQTATEPIATEPIATGGGVIRGGGTVISGGGARVIGTTTGGYGGGTVISGGYSGVGGTVFGGTTGGYVSGGTVIGGGGARVIGGTPGGYVIGGGVSYGGGGGSYISGGTLTGGVRYAGGGVYAGGTTVAGGSAFDRLDTNHDGVITRSEFASALR